MTLHDGGPHPNQCFSLSILPILYRPISILSSPFSPPLPLPSIIYSVIIHVHPGLSHAPHRHAEQEQLLTQLRDSETSANELYTILFTVLPLVVTLPFLWYLVGARSAATALLCLLSATSLLSSAYIMYFVPVGTSAMSTSLGGGSVSGSGFGSGSGSASRRRPSSIFPSTTMQGHGRGGGGGFGARLQQLPDLLASVSDESPINRFLPYLNGSICALLLLAAWAYCARTDVPEGLWLFLLLPAVIFGMVVMARTSIGEIQRGLNELQGMRYEYKGA